MTTSHSKKQILQENGYRYHFDRMIYFNQSSKKVFSFEVIDDHDEKWLEEKIHEPNPKNEEWAFYNNGNIPEQIKIDIMNELKS